MQEPKTLAINLSPDQIRNLVAFGNRATMKGSEADLWVALKNDILTQADQAAASAAKEQTGLEVVGSAE